MMHNRDTRYNLKDVRSDKYNQSMAPTAAESAQYLADMLLEMRNLSKTAGLKNLQGILELACYEAFASAHRVAVPEGEVQRLEEMGADARKAENT